MRVFKIIGTPPFLDNIYWNSPYKHNLFWTFFKSKKLPVDWNWHTCCVFYSGLEIIICICVHLYHAHSNIRTFLADALQLSMEGVQVWLGKDLLPQFTDKGVSMDEAQGAGRTRGWVQRLPLLSGGSERVVVGGWDLSKRQRFVIETEFHIKTVTVNSYLLFYSFNFMTICKLVTFLFLLFSSVILAIYRMFYKRYEHHFRLQRIVQWRLIELKCWIKVDRVEGVKFYSMGL